MNKPLSSLLGLFLISQAQANVQTYFDQAKNDPNALYAFFKKMPKGGELHYHLAGGAYPEAMLEIAAKGNYCLDTKTLAVNDNVELCRDKISMGELTNTPALYTKTVRAWSLQDFIPGVESSHDHFFNSFFKFLPIVSNHSPELIVDVVKRAANQQEQYLELMILPDNANSLSFGVLLKGASSFAEMREILLANQEFQKNIEHTIIETERALKQARHELGCDSNPESEKCKLTLKFLYYSLREQPLDAVFAQTLNAFEAVSRSQSKGGSLVGVNLVQAEDGIISLRDYRQQMQIFQYLHQLYPQVNISLHAGEITSEIVTPSDLNYHIHDALFIGQAQRIGHGVDIAHEDDVDKTLDYMAKQQKAVEINLISNKRILNVSGKEHPLNYYLKHHVPVVLSTDDEGILRTDLTSQYVEAVIGHGLDYPTIKQINRNALTYSFAPGKSIWADAVKAQLVSECQDLNSVECKEFIKNNQKGQLQWTLEQKLKAFESQY
ncbi:adenosine deaminase [Legionella lytica]|uniref:adenosine deaminase n=1 Tax=Legionella lytica TaxID=96232 RepID=A0ABW8D8J3_9GAMM